MIDFFIKIFVFLHNFSYKAISMLVVKKNGGLHPKHRILNYHDFFLTNIQLDDSVLDIGCGNGAVAYDLAKKSRKITAIDISKENIEIARKKFSQKNLEYIIGDATNYDFKSAFDVIILSNVLEHIKNRVDFLSKIKKLAPKILIRVPLLTRDWLSVYKKENGFEYRLDPTHYTEYTEEDFMEEIKRSGLSIEKYYVKFGEIYAIIR
ncbi:MAG: class I SAM-dependent methyltransferase [Candidatus Moranbacteria bacterium]|nr:class I SAM-dependent methyltransferase [Candidatus Moranbacteria bacterium]